MKTCAVAPAKETIVLPRLSMLSIWIQGRHALGAGDAIAEADDEEEGPGEGLLEQLAHLVKTA